MTPGCSLTSNIGLTAEASTYRFAIPAPGRTRAGSVPGNRGRVGVSSRPYSLAFGLRPQGRALLFGGSADRARAPCACQVDTARWESMTISVTYEPQPTDFSDAY